MAQRFKWAGGRSLEVDAGDVETATVAGALEFLVGLQPIRRAAEVGTGGAQSVDLALIADDPDVAVLETSR